MGKLKKILYAVILVVLIIFTLTNIAEATTVKITTETLNLRKEASTDSDIVAQISIGEECELIEDEGDWYQVKYNDYTGYISKEYAEIVSDGSNDETNEQSNSQTENTEITNTEANDTNTQEENNTVSDNTGSENVTPETNTNVQGKLNKQTDLKIVPLINGSNLENLKQNVNVTVIEELNGWSYIQTDTTSGWVRSDCITVEESKENNDGQNDKTAENNDNSSDKPDETSDFTERTMYTNDLVNIREEPSTSSGIIMVVETNTSLKVVGESGDWYEVETSQGNAYVSKELLSDKKVSVTNRGNIDRTSKDNEEDGQAENTSNSNSSSASNDSVTGEKVVSYAKKFLGVPYVYGGASSSGFDCSGFTMYVYDNFGISMRHGAQAQAKLGEKINADKSSKSSLLNNLKAGDLVFFLDYETMDEIGHCGIYIGNGDFIHASSGSGYCVKINSLLPGEYYNTRYCGARRVI